MKDGDPCPECGCGAMRRHTSYVAILVCTWCYHEVPDEDATIVRPRTPDAKQKRL